MKENVSESGLEIAIIGMAGRFPEADDLEQFWENLVNGRECVSFFSDEELLAEGISPDLLKKSNYIKAKPYLKGIEYFDAHLFGYTSREVEMMDPHLRVFHECVHHALEDAGYNPENYKGLIGLYAGASTSLDWLSNFVQLEKSGSLEKFESGILVYKDMLSQLISYRLNLTGPSHTIYTACSTSLAAVHLACRGLLLGECNIVVAGGVTVELPKRSGYLFEEGMIHSPDGHCRAFAAGANGTIFGDGAGAVVLKRLEDAAVENDHIYAVIKASACNNDGRRKVGFAAPSVEGQTEVIRAAHELAQIVPESISYLEAHGTGTDVGDPLEIEALIRVFNTGKKGYCPIGSVKSNVGHLHAAAGAASLIKTVLVIQHKRIPPAVNFSQPNPKIDFENSPFFVNTQPLEWKNHGFPLRAGISSFGIGGTNIHLILEEPPEIAVSEKEPDIHHRGQYKILVFSASTQNALDSMTGNFVRFLRDHPGMNIADAAYTLQLGRRVFGLKRLVVACSPLDAADVLEGKDSRRLFTASEEYTDRPVVFMFAPQGAQYPGMGYDLYKSEPVFKAQVDQCCDILKPHLGLDLRDILYTHRENQDTGTPEGSEPIHQTWLAQPALFVIEYAAAKLWMSWGVKPFNMVGHSVGEYVAAALAGVFTLEDALGVVAARGRLMQECPVGSMLAVGLTEEAVGQYIDGQVSLAVVNQPDLCVLAGETEFIHQLQTRFDEKNLFTRRLKTSHAFHSHMMAGAVNRFIDIIKQVPLREPKLPFVSCITGMPITGELACDPQYWGQQIRRTVRFSHAATELLKDENSVFLEVGPGTTLSDIIKNHLQKDEKRILLSSMPKHDDTTNSSLFALTTLGRLWLAGAAVNWEALYPGEQRKRLSLPLYPFDRKRYWSIGPRSGPVQHTDPVITNGKQDIDHWFYLPSWKRTLVPPGFEPGGISAEPLTWLIFEDEWGLGKACARLLLQAHHTVITIQAGKAFEKTGANTFTVNPLSREDYQGIASELEQQEIKIDKIIHAWLVGIQSAPGIQGDFLSGCKMWGYDSLIQAVGAFESTIFANTVSLNVITDSMFDVNRGQRFYPEKQLILGPCTVIPQEYFTISCTTVDIVLDEYTDPGHAAYTVLGEIVSNSRDIVTAYRERNRLTRYFAPVQVPVPGNTNPFAAPGGVYLVVKPPGGKKVSIQSYLEQKGAKHIVFVQGNNVDSIKPGLKEALAIKGKIDGVIYWPGIGENDIETVSRLTPAGTEILNDGVNGLYELGRAAAGVEIGFCLVQSSLSAVLGGLGFAAVAAYANFADAFVIKLSKNSPINWMAVDLDFTNPGGDSPQAHSPGKLLPGPGIQQEEESDAYDRIFSFIGRTPHIVLSTCSLAARLQQWIAHKDEDHVSIEKKKISHFIDRPPLSAKYEAPTLEAEKVIGEIMEELLSIKPIGLYDNFFELGGHSLLATQMVSCIKDIFPRDLPLKTIFETPTIAGVMECLIQVWESKNTVEEIAQTYREYQKLTGE